MVTSIYCFLFFYFIQSLRAFRRATFKNLHFSMNSQRNKNNNTFHFSIFPIPNKNLQLPWKTTFPSKSLHFTIFSGIEARPGGMRVAIESTVRH